MSRLQTSVGSLSGLFYLLFNVRFQAKAVTIN